MYLQKVKGNFIKNFWLKQQLLKRLVRTESQIRVEKGVDPLLIT